MMFSTRRFLALVIFLSLGVSSGFSKCPEDLDKFQEWSGLTLAKTYAAIFLPPIGIPLVAYAAYETYQIRKMGRLLKEVRAEQVGPVTSGLLKALSKVDPGNKIFTLEEIRKALIEADNKNQICKYSEPVKIYSHREYLEPLARYKNFKNHVKDLIKMSKLSRAQLQSDFLDEEEDK